MIGEIIQHILNAGFMLRYEYNPNVYPLFGDVHIFRIMKYAGEIQFEAQWIINNYEVKSLYIKSGLLAEADHFMGKVDEMITQRRLIEEALT